MEGNDITSQFACPVCLEIPPANIFQCCNGHTVCGTCFKNLPTCPTCRTEYGKVQIRNRALEAILDDRKFECPNKLSGCNEDLHRSEIFGHLKRCEFSEVSVPLCKWLGYKCRYQTSTKNTSETIFHFNNVHTSATSEIGQAVKFSLEDFANSDFNKSSIWTPIILVDPNNVELKGTCILFAKTNGEDKTVSLVTLMLGIRRQECGDFSAHFVLNSNKEWKIPMEWSTTGVTLYDAEEAIRQPLFRMAETTLKADYMNADGCLEILAVVKRNGDGGFSMAGMTTTETVHVLNENDLSSMDMPTDHGNEMVDFEDLLPLFDGSNRRRTDNRHPLFFLRTLNLT